MDERSQRTANESGGKIGLERLQLNIEGHFPAMDTDVDCLYYQEDYIRSTIETDSDKLQKHMEQMISVMETAYREALIASQ